jgi:hypothetical protein
MKEYVIKVGGEKISSLTSKEYSLEFETKNFNCWQPYKRIKNKFFMRNLLGQTISFDLDAVDTLKDIKFHYTKPYNLKAIW